VVRAVEEQSARLTATLQDAGRRMHELSEAQYRAALAAHESLNQRDKYRYFVRNLLRGDTPRKLHFLVEKFLPGR